MAVDKLLFVDEKFTVKIGKGNTIELPFQVVRDLGLQKNDLVEFEFITMLEDDGEIYGATMRKREC